MIESKEQVFGDFLKKAQAFLSEPNFVTGIELDDASVTLKRYVLTEMRDGQLGSALGRVQKSIRNLDVAAVSELVTAVEDRLSD